MSIWALLYFGQTSQKCLPGMYWYRLKKKVSKTFNNVVNFTYYLQIVKIQPSLHSVYDVPFELWLRNVASYDLEHS